MKKILSIPFFLSIMFISNMAYAVLIPGYGDVTNWATSASRISGTGGAFAGVDPLVGLVGDDLTDGAINIGTGDKFGLGFATGITNNTGADLLIFDGRFSADGVYVEINGLELLVSPTSFVDTTLNFVLKNTAFTFDLYAAALDLSTWGVANGATINSLAIRGTGESDIMGAAGLSAANIPEPTTLAMMGLGLIGFGFSRRKFTS